mmetsp:Transcript_120578/g.240092  ORF Transcript_120578/g.240092 Transcript_120578/m.240092 type:complete len:95 (-) Transcript_120578:1723-2007(-)
MSPLTPLTTAEGATCLKYSRKLAASYQEGIGDACGTTCRQLQRNVECLMAMVRLFWHNRDGLHPLPVVDLHQKARSDSLLGVESEPAATEGLRL